MCLSGYAQNQRLLRDVVYAPQRVYLLRQLHIVLLLLRRYARLTASRTTLVSPYQKGKTSLDLNEARDDGVLGWQWYRWTICKQPAPRSRQITTSTPHHSMFTERMLFFNSVKALKANT